MGNLISTPFIDCYSTINNSSLIKYFINSIIPDDDLLSDDEFDSEDDS